MQHRAQCVWAQWRIDYVVQYLSRRSHHYDLVLKKRAIGVIRMPEFGIENLIERARFERVRIGETDHVTTKITRHIISAADFGQSAGGKRFINFLAWVRRQTLELAVRQAINRRASFSIDRIGKKIHEPDSIIQQLRRRN